MDNHNYYVAPPGPFQSAPRNEINVPLPDVFPVRKWAEESPAPIAIPDQHAGQNVVLVFGTPYGPGDSMSIPIQYSLLSLFCIRKPTFRNHLKATNSKLAYIVHGVDSTVFLHILEWVYTGEWGPPETRMPRAQRRFDATAMRVSQLPDDRNNYVSNLNPWKFPMLIKEIDDRIFNLAQDHKNWLVLNATLALTAEKWNLDKSFYPQTSQNSTTRPAEDQFTTLPDDYPITTIAKHKINLCEVTLEDWCDKYIGTVYGLADKDSCLRVYERAKCELPERLAIREKICKAWEDETCREKLKQLKMQHPDFLHDIQLLFEETNLFPEMRTPEGLLD